MTSSLVAEITRNTSGIGGSLLVSKHAAEFLEKRNVTATTINWGLAGRKRFVVIPEIVRTTIEDL